MVFVAVGPVDEVLEKTPFIKLSALTLLGLVGVLLIVSCCHWCDGSSVGGTDGWGLF